MEAMVLKRFYVCTFFILGALFGSKGVNIVSRQTGNWTSAASWIYYCSGTTSFTLGSAIVTGVGTQFTSDLVAGDVIMLQSSAGVVRGTVLTISNNTSLTMILPATETVSGEYGKQKAPTSAASEDIFVSGGYTITTDFAADFTIDNLTVAAGSVLTHSVNKKIKINKSLLLDGTINGSGNKDIELNGVNDASATLSGTGFFSLSAADLMLKNNITIPATANLTFNNSGKFNINNKTATSDGRINILQPSNFGMNGTFVNNSSSSYLKYTYLADFPIILSASAVGNTVEYGFASGSYDMGNSTYHHLILSGSGTSKTSNNFFTINGDLTIGSGCTLDANANTDDILIYGNWDNDNGGSFTECVTKTVSFLGINNNQTIYTPSGGETFGKLTINNTFSGGTVTSTGNIYISNGQTLTLTSGSFNMGTYTLDDASGAANLTMTGGELILQKLSVTLPELSGTYSISGGTIRFSGSGSQTVRGETVSSPIVADYYHVILSGSGTKTLEGNLDVNGNLNIDGTAQLEVSSSNNSSNIRNIFLAGSWINTSTAVDPFIERTGTITFDGASDASVTASPISAGETFYNVVLNKSTNSKNITLNNNVTVTNDISLTLGKMVTSTSNKYLIMDVSSTVSLASDNSHVVGPIKKNTNSTTEFRFPTGKGGYYRWIGVTPVNTNSTTYVAEYFYQAPSLNTNVGAGINHLSDIEYWSLDRSGASPANAAVQLSWTTNSGVDVNTTDLLISQWDGSSQWVDRCGGACTIGAGSTISNGSIKINNLSTFNDFLTLASPNTNNDLGITRYCVADGNWGSTATWSNRSGASSGASVPGATNRVVIERGYRIDVNTSVSCLKLTVGSNGIGILDFNNTTNTVSVGSEGIIVNSNGDVEGTNVSAVLQTTGDISLNADITSESGGGNSTFVLRRHTTGGKTISGTGVIDNLDIDATTINSGNITVNSVLQGSNVLTNTGTFVFKGTNANFNSTAFDASSVGNTVHFNNAISNFDVRENTPYHHLIISGNSTKISVSDLTVNGDLTISSGSTLDIDNNDKEVVIKGHFINSGVFIPSTNGAREVTFNGSSEQNITSGGSCFYRLYINNTSATGVVFQDAACIQTGGKVDLADGYLFLGNNNLVLQGTSTSPSSASSGSFIVTNGTGQLKATCSNITFPVGTSGDASSYTPLVINNTGTSDIYGVRICDGVYDEGTCGGTAGSGGYVNKTWQITESIAGGSNVSLTLQWDASKENAEFTRTGCYMSHHNGSGWQAITTVASASGSGPYSFTATGVTSFSPFTVGSGGGALPIELVYFDVELFTNNEVKVNWITASEINNDFFTIERSADGLNFEIVDVVVGAGNSSSTLSYLYLDKDPLSGMSYYRLKQTDFDGQFTYSEVKAVNNLDKKMQFSIFPNPTDQRFNVVFVGADQEEDVSISIYTFTGQKVYSTTFLGVDSGSFVTVDLGLLPNGNYFVVAKTSTNTLYNKLVIKSAF